MNHNPKTIVQTAQIPPVPHVLQRVLSLVENPRTSSADLEKIVSTEPALSTRLLKWVNSAYYALPRKVSSISHAIILLGYSTVKSIASGMILLDAFDDMPKVQKDYVSQIWKHTLKASSIMKVLAAKEKQDVQDDLFLSAMISDVGYLVMSQYFQADYNKLIERNYFPSIEEEMEAFGINHAEVGSELLALWQFPEIVLKLVKIHHDTELPDDMKKLVHYLQVVDFLAYQTDLGEYLNRDVGQIDPSFLTLLNLIDWTWDRLKENKTIVLQSLTMIEQLYR